MTPVALYLWNAVRIFTLKVFSRLLNSRVWDDGAVACGVHRRWAGNHWNCGSACTKLWSKGNLIWASLRANYTNINSSLKGNIDTKLVVNVFWKNIIIVLTYWTNKINILKMPIILFSLILLLNESVHNTQLQESRLRSGAIVFAIRKAEAQLCLRYGRQRRHGVCDTEG